MLNKNQLPSIALWIIFGFIFCSLVVQTELALSSSASIIGMFLSVDALTLKYIELVPNFLVLVFWLIFIFGYVKKQQPNGLISAFPKKLAKQMGLLTIVMFLIARGLSLLQANIYMSYIVQNTPTYENYVQESLPIALYSFIYFAEIVVMLIGLFSIVNRIPTQEDENKAPI